MDLDSAWHWDQEGLFETHAEAVSNQSFYEMVLHRLIWVGRYATKSHDQAVQLGLSNLDSMSFSMLRFLAPESSAAMVLMLLQKKRTVTGLARPLAVCLS